MLEFLKKHWFILALTAAALAAAAVAIFFPPAILAALTISLASSAAFAALGTFAVPVAVTIVAVASAATVYAVGGLLKGAASLFSWGYNKLFGPKNPEQNEDVELYNRADDPVESDEQASCHSREHKHVLVVDEEAEEEEEEEEEDIRDRHHAESRRTRFSEDAPVRRRAAPANDAGCCNFWTKKPVPVEDECPQREQTSRLSAI